MPPRNRTGNSQVTAQATLKRSLSLTLTTFYGLGNILGAGIYVLIGAVIAHAGDYAPLSFLVASLLACLTAFSYAELSARFPQSAGEAVYVQEGIGVSAVSVLVGLLIILAGIVSAATILRGFAGYLRVFITLPETGVMLLLVFSLGGLAVWGIIQSVLVSTLITVIEIAGLLLVIAVTAPVLSIADIVSTDFTSLSEIDTWFGVFAGGFLAFYAFIGFEDMVNVAEEVKQPERNLPRAILLALLVSSLLYFLVALVAINSVPGVLLAGSEAPLAFLYQYVTGREPVMITIIGLVAVINGALVQIIMASRVCYGMGRKHWLPPLFGEVHAVTQTPVIATVAVASLVLVMALWFPLEGLAKSTSFLLLTVFSLVNLSLWRLKRNTTQPPGILCVPRWIPACGCVVSLAFVVIQATLDITD